MPVSIHSLKHMTKTCAPIEFEGGGTLTLTYRVHAFTPNTETDLRASEEEGQVSDSLVKTLAVLLENWDLTDEKGKVLSINEKTLRDVPISILGKCFTAISEDQLPPPEKSGSSFD